MKLLGAVAASSLLAGCSQSAVPSQHAIAFHSNGHSLTRPVPVAVNAAGIFKVHPNFGRHSKSFDTCPTSGAIEYISDFNDSVISIFAGNFANQPPCGQIAGSGILLPQGLFVNRKTHDLYVANTGGFDVLVFHRGSTTPFRTYIDPTGQYPLDVTVANDGTVLASNAFQATGIEKGSISTWRRSGKFVANFPMHNDVSGNFVTVQRSGALYFNDVDAQSGNGLLWSGSCPRGICGVFKSTGATTVYPGGLRSADNEDVVQVDQNAPGGGSIITYETFPNGVSCAIGGGGPAGMDIDQTQQNVYYADPINNVGGQIAYPSCATVGTVPGNLGGLPVGAAADPPGGL
ncbi:MAG TPA: hypothetical protein VJN22_06840 [Candidatus Eremiobacteraceae bacterium]|nr:hypothetical protein [Candidatus Eremiobacteraceae bacterium]